jgi:NAD(P)-dependent dehydrogenase (short-subunit alcohol dehydrogenase family)
MRLAGKVAIVSGAGAGMGRATALLFAQEGASVVITARHSERIEETAARIRAAGGQGLAVQANAADSADAERVVRTTLDTYGRLDVLQNTGGGGFTPNFLGPDEVDVEFFDQVVMNNVRSGFLMARFAVPHMAAQGGGSIVNVSAADKTRLDGNLAYGTGKAGVIGLTRNMARALYARNIRVNAILPGLVRIPLSEGPIQPPVGHIRRRGRPEDIAYLALYLASDESAWVTGQTFVVDGGDEVRVPRETGVPEV